MYGDRTNNDVKNHFYSKMRKSIRKLNRIVDENLHKKFRKIKSLTLYNIIEANEEIHTFDAMVNEEIANFYRRTSLLD